MALLDPGFDAGATPPATRIGQVRLPADPSIDEAIDAALARAGLDPTDVRLPGWDAATEATMTILSAEAWSTHAQLWWDHAADLSPDVADRLAAASRVTAGRWMSLGPRAGSGMPSWRAS